MYDKINKYILNGIEDVEKFRKYSESTGEFDFDFENEHYICFNGAEYIEFLINEFMSNRVPEKNVKVNNPFVPINFQDLREMKGFYVCEMVNNVENHKFVIYVNNNNINVYNSYGGCKSFYYVTTSKVNWISKNKKLNDYELEIQNKTMRELYGIPTNYNSKVVFDNELFCKFII